MSIDQPNQQFGPLDSVSMTTGEQPKPQHRYRMILITGVVVIIGILGIIISKNANLQEIIKNSVNYSRAPTDVNPQSGSTSMEADTVVSRSDPWLEVVSADNKTTYGINDTITLRVNGFSQGKDITGYDMLLPIDSNMFEVVSITSVLPGFSIFEFDKGTYRTVTGIKDVGVQTATPFDNTSLLQIVLKPKKTGTSVLTISQDQGKEKTQFVDNEVNVIVPQRGSLQIAVQ